MVKSQYFFSGHNEAEKLIKNLRDKINKIPSKQTLAVILVGNDQASKVYVTIKEKRAKEIGVAFLKYELSSSVSEKKIIDLINRLNKERKVTGIMIQLPLPKKFKTNKILSVIDISKDVDGLRYSAICQSGLVSGSLKRCRNKFGTTKHVIPPTIQSIIHLIKLPKLNLAGRKAAILCHSQEFAESLKKELVKEKIQPFVVLTPARIQKEEKLDSQSWLRITKEMDILVVALGQKYFLKPEMIKKNAIIIDVGINRVGKKIFGDVDHKCFQKTKYISPVPGGVGPLTVAYLFKNLIKLSKAK